MPMRKFTLDLEPMANVTRSPKQGYQWPHKKDRCPPKLLKKESMYCRFVIYSLVHNEMRIQYYIFSSFELHCGGRGGYVLMVNKCYISVKYR